MLNNVFNASIVSLACWQHIYHTDELSEIHILFKI